MVLQAVTHSRQETMALAEALASACRPGDVIALEGALGAGKTTFVKGLARGLGVKDDRAVVSPSFVLMRQYEGRLILYHFDAYRLHSAAEMDQIGCQETFDSGGISVVEWADRVRECLPARRLEVSISFAGQTDRLFRIAARGEGAAERMEELRRCLSQWLSPTLNPGCARQP